MAWDYGNADTSWMTENIGSSGEGTSAIPVGALEGLFSNILGGQTQQSTTQQPTVWGLTPEDWRNIQYMTGAMGQAALKGTDNEWLGNMAAVSAQMAKNAQVSAQNKQFQDVLAGINNPNVNASSYTRKNPDGSSETWKAGGTVQDYTAQIPQLVQQQNAPSPSTQPAATPASNAIIQNLGATLSQGPSFFAKAQQPWWHKLGQQEAM